MNAPKYVLKASGIHGRGLIATEDLPAGTQIIQDRDIWQLDETTLQDDQRILDSFRQLRPRDRDSVLTLSGDFGSAAEGNRFLNASSRPDAAARLRTIYMRCSQGFNLFKEIARVNHSCVPNTELMCRVDNKIGVLIAVKAVKKGEELTLDYGEQFWTYEVRREYLKQVYDIEQCKCKLCAASRKKREESDERRRNLEKGSLRLRQYATAAVEGPKEVLHLVDLMLEWARNEDVVGAELYKIYEDGLRAAQDVASFDTVKDPGLAKAKEGGLAKMKEYGSKMAELGPYLGAITSEQAANIRRACKELQPGQPRYGNKAQ